MPLICSMCLKNDFSSVRISPSTGARYCEDCWRKLDLAEHINRPVEVMTTDMERIVPIVNGVVPQQHPCGFCGFQYRPGREIPEIGWTCETCERALNADMGGTEMAIGNTNFGCAATVHMKLQFKGSERAIQFFNYVMERVDRDWPLKASMGVKFPEPCGECGGYIYPRAMVDAGEVKKVAKECGVRKLKVKYWGEAMKCKKVLMLPAAGAS